VCWVWGARLKCGGYGGTSYARSPINSDATDVFVDSKPTLATELPGAVLEACIATDNRITGEPTFVPLYKFD
jgi:hypothetical protein